MSEDPHAWTKPHDPSATEAAPMIEALRESLVRYEIAAAKYRKARDNLLGIDGTVGDMMTFKAIKAEFRYVQDQLVACWRDVIHEAMKEIPPNWKLLHQVMNAMDGFLNRAKD